MSWCSGVDIYEAAADARQLAAHGGYAPLLELGERLVEAYSHLHAQGVVHGDVHPRNVRVAGNAVVTIIDYGLAGRPLVAGAATGGRGGIDFFLEPEIAAARLAGRPDPALSFQGEQYSLGALLYLLLTGAHTYSFSLEPGGDAASAARASAAVVHPPRRHGASTDRAGTRACPRQGSRRSLPVEP